MSDFIECDECRAKTGSPVLCGGCLVNRILIFKLTAENKDLKQRNEALEEENEQLKKTSIKIGKNSKVGNIRIGKRSES